MTELERAQLERAREKLDAEVRTRFAGLSIEKVELLQYGDDPEIEPGELLARVVLGVPDGADASDKEVRRQVFDSFEAEHRAAIRTLRKDIGGREGPAVLEFTVSGAGADPGERGPVFKMKVGGRPSLAIGGDQSLTPVMARVGAEDLETLDMLISVGIAGSRAEAVRWALARIRERPAYEQIRARSREIEELKSQF